MTRHAPEFEMRIETAAGTVHGDLLVPDGAAGIVVFAHGSGSSRRSPRNRQVAGVLNEAGFATLLFDLLTEREDEIDRRTAELRFDIPRLGERLVLVTDSLERDERVAGLPLGYFGASTGAAAALVAAAERQDRARAVVSRGGRPDLAGEALEHVTAPTLLIVGGADTRVIEMNEDAMRRMRSPVELRIVPRATHLFEEAGALEQVAELAREWFERHLLG